MNAEVLTISVDSMFVHKVWEEQELSKISQKKVPFPMVSDLNGTIGKLYNVYDEDLKLNLRGTFIIDPDGIVQAAEILSAGAGRSIAETIRKIQAVQHVKCTNGAEVTPVNWEPGKQVLKPSPELAGNVWSVWKK